ncbi:MAG: hypothetical protein WAK91_13965 [Candidatus Acidiferrales bacterium]|jgi:hypothetical protein
MRAARRLLPLPTLFLLALSSVAVPPPQDAHWWDSAVESLASKIAGDVALHATISLTVKNLSSLDSAAVAGIRADLEMGLQHHGFAFPSLDSGKAAASTSIDVTLSENLREYVWAARIYRGDGERIAIVSVPRAAATPAAAPEPAISLQRQIIWRQAGKILDFAVSTNDAGGAFALIVLEPERLAFYKSAGEQLELDRAVAIAHAKPWPRDLHGRIDLDAHSASLPGLHCVGNFSDPGTIQCTETPSEEAVPQLSADATIQIAGREVDAVRMNATCGPDSVLLAGGIGDWTQPDAIRAHALADQQPQALSGPLEYAGPVLVLWPSSDRRSARVVSRNLLTGMYEASIVSISCNR